MYVCPNAIYLLCSGPMDTFHATTVVIDGSAVMLRGPAGSGKSDLALRLIEAGARLIADDYTEIEVRDGQLLAKAPPSIRGLLEVRGIGVMELDYMVSAPLHLIVNLVDFELIERLPEHLSEEINGIQVPVVEVDPFEASASAKVHMALRAYREELFIEYGHHRGRETMQ